MATTEAKIAALEDAIDTGSRKVTFRSGGTLREVEYRTLDEMERALKRLKNKNKTPRRVTLASM